LPPGAVGALATFGFIAPLRTGNVILPEKAEQISAAPEGATICALLESGKISCWGLNYFGQLGIGNTTQPNLSHLEVLDAVDVGEPAVEVRSAFAHTCALGVSGRVYCWGDGLYGRLGSGHNGPRWSPGLVEIGEPVVGLAVGFDHNCVLLARGAVRCWGNNHQGQLGYGHTLAIGDDETPVEAASLEGPAGRQFLGGDVALDIDVNQIVTFPASSIRAGNGIWDSSPTCALPKDNRLARCWGRNDSGQLGYGHNLAGAIEHTPIELGDIRSGDRFVDTGGQVFALAEGGRCALRIPDEDEVTGSLYCWGPNDHGLVGAPGDGNASPSLTTTPFHIGPVHWWPR
jgi:alpha-tubulin suppressor-like RCC1 family protein